MSTQRWMRRLPLVALLSASLLTWSAGCTNDENTAPVEPVTSATDDGMTPPPDAPGMESPATPADADPNATPPSESDPLATPAPDQATDSAADAAAPGSEASPEELPGSLTDEPFGAPADNPPMQDDGSSAATAPDDQADGSISGSFEENQPEYQDDNAGTPAKAVKNKKSTDGKKAATASKGRQTRYVDAVMLNVRSKPSSKAKIVRRLLGGEQVSVEGKGAFAKIKNGEYVRSRFLSSSPTRVVSNEEADAAWKGQDSYKQGGTKKASGKKSKAKGKSHAKKGKPKSKAKAKAKAKAVAPAPAPEPAPEPTADPADPIAPIEPEPAAEAP